MVARGVVASLEDAEVTSGGAGNCGAVVAVGVIWREFGLSAVEGLWTTVSTVVNPATATPELLEAFGVVGSELWSRENRGDWLRLPPLLDGTVLLL